MGMVLCTFDTSSLVKPRGYAVDDSRNNHVPSRGWLHTSLLILILIHPPRQPGKIYKSTSVTWDIFQDVEIKSANVYFQNDNRDQSPGRVQVEGLERFRDHVIRSQ